MGYSIVNILGGLLIVTSTMVVVSKNIKHAISWYAVQSLVLMGLLATLGATTGAQELLMWARSAFITKVVLVPHPQPRIQEDGRAERRIAQGRP